MASGYEKSDCGVAPNRGWARPTRFENHILLLVGIAGSVLWLVASGAAILRLIRWLAG